jgi:HEAT repeat protein
LPIFGPPNINKLKVRRDISGLIKALNYRKDPEVREKAAEALGELGDRTATEPLLFMLEDEGRDRGSTVVKALGRIRDHRAVPALISRIKERDPASCRQELSALENIGRPAVGALLGMLKEKAQNAKQAIVLIQALEKIEGKSVISGLIDLVSPKSPSLIVPLAEALERLAANRAVPPLVTVLKAAPEESWSAHLAAVLKRMGWQPGDVTEDAALSLAERQWERLAAIGEPAVELLIPLLRISASSEIQKAAETLGYIGDDRAVEPLSALLNHKRPEIAIVATRALGDIGGSPAVEGLLQNAVNSESPTVQVEAEKSLVKIGASAVGPLIAQLKSGDPRERKTAVRILGEIGDRRALRPLVSARDDNSLQPELHAALEKLGWQPSDG